jgi:hypothetical protein
VLTTVELPSAWTLLLSVSNSKKNFSASIVLAPVMIASAVLSGAVGLQFNHVCESAVRSARPMPSRQAMGSDLIGQAPGAPKIPEVADWI